MANIQLGDLAQSYQLRTENARLKRQMAEITQELSTGRTADLAAHVRADLAPIAGIEHDLRRLDGYETTVTETVLLTDTLQNALERVQNETQVLSEALIVSGNANTAATIQAMGTNANQTFQSVVATLGMQVGGRSLLSGIATDQPALAEADTMMAELLIAVAGLASAEDVETAVTDWFAPGGGYDTDGYLGSNTALSPVSIGRNQTVAMDLTAEDQRIRDTLASVAMGALLAEGVLAGNVDEQMELAALAGEAVLSSQTGLSTMRAETGAKQATLEHARQSNSTVRFALEMTRTEIVAIDPYDSATQLEAVQIQLESLYALTSRLGRMSLVDYLR